MKKIRHGLAQVSSLLLIICLMSGCGAGAQEKKSPKGSRSNPYMAGETVTYQGANKNGESYSIELTLTDTERGFPVNEMFHRASGLDVEDVELVNSQKELLVIRMEVAAVSSKNDRMIAFSEENGPGFQLVSSDGIVYEDELYTYFDNILKINAGYYSFMYSDYDSSDLEGTMLKNPVDRRPDSMYPGASQTLYLFYLIDINDRRPVLNLHSYGQDDIWFRASLYERERGDERISADEWNNAQEWEDYPWWSGFGIDPDEEYGDEYSDLYSERDYGYDYDFEADIDEDGNYGGSAETPLPIGEMGLYVERSYDDAWAMEMEVESCVRGQAALDLLTSSAPDHGGFYLGQGKELLAAQININYLESMAGDSYYFTSSDFLLYDSSEKETEYSCMNGMLEAGTVELYSPGTASLTVYFEIDADEQSPMLVFGGSYDEYLCFDLTANKKLSGNLDSYESVYKPAETNRDSTKPAGSRQNPISFQEEYDFSEGEDWYHSNGTMKVLESYRGSEAEAYIADKSNAPLGTDEEYFVVRVENTEKHKSDYDYTDFYIMNSNGVAGSANRIPETAMEDDDSKDIVYVGFKIKTTEQDLLLGYGYYEEIWFEVQDGDHRIYPTL